MNYLDEMVDILGGNECPDDLKHYLTCVSLFGVATVCSSVRANVICPTDFNEIPTNVYAIAIAGSGLSKSRSLGYVEDLFIAKASDKIKELANAKMETLDPFNMEEVAKLSKEGVKISLIFKSATDSAVSAVRSIMDKVGLYSVNIALDELGSVLLKEYDLLSDTLLNAYDRGKLKPNLRRTTGVSTTESPVPHNLLMFGSPTLIFESKTETEKAFYDLLSAGLARRCLFSEVKTKTNHYTLKVDNTMQNRINAISNRLVDIVDKYNGKSIPLSNEASIFYEEYETQCKLHSEACGKFEIYNQVCMQNKHWIALKISGLLAMLDLSNTVELSHYLQAIKIVDDSYSYMQQLTKREEKYELIVEWLTETGNSESEYTLTQSLPFYKEVKNKKSFWDLAKGYAYENNITLMIEDKRNITFYQAKAKKKTNLEEPLLFSYSMDIARDYYSNDSITWKDFHKVMQKDGVCYSAHTFKDGHRTNDNAIEGFELLMLDVDSGTPLDIAKLLLDNYTYLIATTRSHNKEKKGVVCDRYRIILPMKNRLELSKEQYSKFMTNLMEDMPIELDACTKDIGRMFYGASGEYWYNEGELFDADKYIPNTQEEEQYIKQGKTLAKGNISGISQYIIRNESNGRNSSLIKLALLLARNGYRENELKEEILRVNKQFNNPLSESELERTILRSSTVRREMEKHEDVEEEYEEEDEFAKVDR